MKKFKPNLEYFKLPMAKILNKIILSKYDFLPIELNAKTPCIFLSPKISKIDTLLINRCIKDKFVFLNDDILIKISNNTLKEKEEKLILKEINNLTKEGFSISVLYGSSPSIFGENEPITKSLALFFRKTKLDIKFLTFPGEYFADPIWADKPRKTKIISSQQITIKQRFLDGLTDDEIDTYFKNSTPSSSSTYLSKFPITINSNNLASGIERMMYCCPHCKNLFSIYSEYSCVKCRNCGMVIEFSPEGSILFSKEITSFDEIENFQFKVLQRKDFTINQLTEYKNIMQIIFKNCKIIAKIIINLQFYAEKLIITNSLTNKKTPVFYEDITFIQFSKNNNVKIITKNAKEFYFKGNNNENFYIIKDLIKLNKN